MAENEELVSRRQLFRGLAGNLLRTIGDLTESVAAERPEPDPPAAQDQEEGGAPLVDPERQAAALRELFDFIEHPPALNGEPQ